MSDNSLFELPFFSIIELSGNDAETFLQSQLCSDVGKLGNTSCQFSAWCNPKGRVIANFILYKSETNFNLIVSKDLTDTILKRFQMYVLRADVTFKDKTNELKMIGLRAPSLDIDNILVPDKDQYISHSEDLSVIRIADKLKRVLIVGPHYSIDELLLKLEKDFTRQAPQLWQRNDIEAKLPWITGNTSESFLPQELNLEHLGGLSYDKGCYPGQEIIARVHYRGNINKGLHSFCTSADNLPASGTKVHMPGTDDGSGIIVNVVKIADKEYRLLVVSETI